MKRLQQVRFRLVGKQADSGIALVTVVAITAVLGILVVSAIAFSIGGIRKAKDSQDWNAALAAAYAGVEEYKSQLANDQTYGRYGNPASTFTGLEVVMPPKPNAALSVGAGKPWAKVAGSGGAAEFRYEVDNSKLLASGSLKIRATGRVGSETRTVVADLKQEGFGHYVYLTDKETTDPYDSNSPCNKYAMERPGSCPKIAFGPGDILTGPVHSNDRMVIRCGASFLAPVTTGYNPGGSGLTYEGSGCVPDFFQNQPPRVDTKVQIPATNSEMKKEVRFDLPDEVPVPGCLYTGPTTIRLNGDGTMQVKSPWTRFVQVSSTGGRANDATCGKPGVDWGRLGSYSGATVRVPDNNVVYVQNVPSVSNDPNFPIASTVTNGGTGSEKVSCGGSDAHNPVGYPKVVDYSNAYNNERPPSSDAYMCRNGDVFVEGTLKGRLSIAAENNVYIVRDISYSDRQRDLLGLVGQNAVIVASPVDYYNRRINNDCYVSRNIDASILSVAHTFMVQNTKVSSCPRNELYDVGRLRVYGSIAQKFRGIVYDDRGSGYAKEYSYDDRLKTISPPKFLAPAQIKYGVSNWSEINPVMKADGSYA